MLVAGLKSKPFILISGMFFLSILLGTFIIAQCKNYGLEEGHTDEYLTALGSAGGFFSSIRFVWSAALDKVSYKKVYGLVLCLQIVIGATLPLVAESNVLYAVWICLANFCEASHFVLIPNELLKIYGEDVASSLFGFTFVPLGVGSLIIIFYELFLLNSLGYDAFFYVMSGFNVVALLLLIFFYDG